MGGHSRLQFPMLLLLRISLLSILAPSVSSSLLSFNVHFSQWGHDPQELLYHLISPRNSSSSLHGSREAYMGHRGRVVLRRKPKKNFVPEACDCSRVDGLMYARPAMLRDKDSGEVASFKMTLCLRVNRELVAGTNSNSNGGRTGLFLFLVPYPWNRNDERIEVRLDNACTDELLQSSSLISDQVVCAHVHYDSAEEVLNANIMIGGHSCLCRWKIDRKHMPSEAAVGLASTTAGDPIKLQNILTWTFHSTLESTKDPPLLRPPESSSGEQQIRLDPWNRNAELNFRYRRNWQENWQLTCSISVSLSYGNTNQGTD